MPQFEIATFSSQIFWLALTFITLTTYVLKISVPRVRSIIDERWKRTDGFRIEATKADEQAKMYFSSRDMELKSAKKKAQEVMAEARQTADRDLQERKQKVLNDLSNRLKDSENSLQNAVDQSLKTLKGELDTFITEIVNVVLSHNSPKQPKKNHFESPGNVQNG